MKNKEVCMMFELSGIWIIALPLALMVVDIVTGFLGAVLNKNLDSSKMRAGYFKKIGEIIMLAIVMLLCVSIGLNKSVGIGTSLYLVITELMSIVENLNALGVKVPNFLKDILNKANEVK